MLSRITDTARRRDWFMLAFELTIVVVGVYLGIALGNWNQDRQEQARADELSVRLLAEFESLAAQSEAIAEQNERKLLRVAELILLIETESDVPQAELIEIVNDISTISMPVFPSGTYAELTATGTLSFFEEEELLSPLVTYDQVTKAMQSLFSTLSMQVNPASEVLDRHLSYRTEITEGEPSRSVVAVDLSGLRSDEDMPSALGLFYNYYASLGIGSDAQAELAGAVVEALKSDD